MISFTCTNILPVQFGGRNVKVTFQPGTLSLD